MRNLIFLFLLSIVFTSCGDDAGPSQADQSVPVVPVQEKPVDRRLELITKMENGTITPSEQNELDSLEMVKYKQELFGAVKKKAGE